MHVCTLIDSACIEVLRQSLGSPNKSSYAYRYPLKACVGSDFVVTMGLLSSPLVCLSGSCQEQCAHHECVASAADDLKCSVVCNN